MTDYIYMLSEGEYSDYMVGGLYRSTMKLSEESVLSLVPAMIREQFPELTDDQVESAARSTARSKNLAVAEAFLGEKPALSLNYDGSVEWQKKKKALFEGKDLKLSNFLVRKGIMERLDYEELHLDEGWI